MKKFIKGTLELELNVTDLVAFEEQHKVAINRWIDWANRLGVALNLGTSDDNTYLSASTKLSEQRHHIARGLLQNSGK